MQADLGIEVTLALFSKPGLQKLFGAIKSGETLSENAKRIIALQDDYIATIDPVISFLQGHNPTLAHIICKRQFLPEASRFAQTGDLAWAFGSMGILDKAKHLATMYLEDLGDLVKECVDPHFGFSRYAERLARSANSFDELYAELQKPYTFIDEWLVQILEKHMAVANPKLVAITVPFPGNVYSAFRCAQWIKQHYPALKLAMGGGFANTELRTMSDVRVMEFFDFITLDDGEAPLENLVKFVNGEIAEDQLKRTFTAQPKSLHHSGSPNTVGMDVRPGGPPNEGSQTVREAASLQEVLLKNPFVGESRQVNENANTAGDDQSKQEAAFNSPSFGRLGEAVGGVALAYYNSATCHDYKQHELGTPDYTGLPLDKYISAIEVVNPMHRMWSDGRWNKLMMAHGCYWGKCTFCDISLDYIKLYEPLAAQLICDRMLTLMEQTGENGFHFVDEAAPPALMRALSLEIIKRKMVVSWWTNIRFEKSFTRDLCQLLKAAGCIAVSGGLEVASDRLLRLIDKGITVAQVARVNRHFTEAGIMVHAYLMYGFPTQTAQETIDSLEMVRQMFKAGILQSGFWHQFAMTAHSPVGLAPEKFGVKAITHGIPAFANNDVVHEDPTGADHDSFSAGLKKSLLNYMHGLCLDDPLYKWFDGLKIPKTTVAPDYILHALEADGHVSPKPTAKVVYLGKPPVIDYFVKSKKGNTWPMASLKFYTRHETIEIKVNDQQGKWLAELLPKLSVYNLKTLTLNEVTENYEAAGLENFELFWYNKPLNSLWKAGLLVV